jgi:hypothetical protein
MTISSTSARVTIRQLPHWLALFAVLIQLIASFGHIHPEDYRFLVHGHGATIVKAGDGPIGGSGPFLAPDIDCAICASAQILGTGALPVAFAPSVLHLDTVTSLAAVDELWLTPPRHLLFSTRAPPLV